MADSRDIRSVRVDSGDTNVNFGDIYVQRGDVCVHCGDTYVTSSCLERRVSTVDTKESTVESPVSTLETSMSIVETHESTAETSLSTKESYMSMKEMPESRPKLHTFYGVVTVADPMDICFVYVDRGDTCINLRDINVQRGDACVHGGDASSCLERRVSTLSYAPTSTPGQRSRTCSVMSTGDVLGSAALAAAALLPDVAAAAAIATKEVAVYRVMMLGVRGTVY